MELRGENPRGNPARGVLIQTRMNRTLLALAAVLFLGWTTLAAGLLATLAGVPGVASRAHLHHAPVIEADEEPQCPRALTARPDSGVKECAWPESLEQRADQPGGYRPVQLRVEPTAAPI